MIQVFLFLLFGVLVMHESGTLLLKINKYKTSKKILPKAIIRCEIL
jgi:hypothetical protein